jgi:hypothetical protein
MTDLENPLLDAHFLRAFFDTVIPPSADGRIPGAGSIGIEESVAAAINADSRSGEVIRAGLAAVASEASAGGPWSFAAMPPSQRVAVVETVNQVHPRLMNAIARHLYLAYYQHPDVLAAIGEPPRPPFPEGFAIEPTDPELLAKLMERRAGTVQPSNE